MILRCFLGLVFCGMVVACGRLAPSVAADADAAVVLPDSFYKSLTGTIGADHVSMHLSRSGGELSGSFYNHSTVWRFRLEGEIDSSGLIRFWTVQDSFAGRFVGEGEIVGRRLDTLSGWTGVFALVESVDGVAQLSQEDFADTLRGGAFCGAFARWDVPDL